MGRRIMGKKIVNLLLFLAVIAAAAGMTVFVGKGASNVMIYNFVFLGIMAAIYLAGMFGGMFRMNSLASALKRASEEITSIFKIPGRTSVDNLVHLEGIFENKYLDGRLNDFTDSMTKRQEGIGDVEEYINEEELNLHIHKRLLEMVPDILTSLGILGTFVGLVWGLKNFEPSNYEAMTSSVSSLVEGIKVAFLTSIYGIALSIVYSVGMKSEYTSLTEQIQAFLDRFHGFVMPSAENESRNLLVSSQKIQTEAMNKMAEQFSVQMADSFEKVITPTFQRMNNSLDMLVTSVTRCQQDAVKEILDGFMKEMRGSFQLQFDDFNQALANLRNSMEQFSSMQNSYLTAAARIMQDNQNIQKMQQQDYQRVTEYLKEAEQSAAKFWVACNQTMKRYVEAAANGMDVAGEAGKASTAALESSKRTMEEFSRKMQEFTEYQRLSYQTMEQVRRLLADVSAAGNTREVYLTGGRSSGMASKETLDKIQRLLAEQGENQEALLGEISKNIKELNKAAQKGKFSLFK